MEESDNSPETVFDIDRLLTEFTKSMSNASLDLHRSFQDKPAFKDLPFTYHIPQMKVSVKVSLTYSEGTVKGFFINKHKESTTQGLVSTLDLDMVAVPRTEVAAVSPEETESVPAGPSPTRPISLGKAPLQTVAKKKYVGAEKPLGTNAQQNRQLNARGDRADILHTFDLLDIGGERYAFRLHDGDDPVRERYLTVDTPEKGYRMNLVTRQKNKQDRITVRERFQVVALGENQVALIAHNGLYVRAEDGGGGALFADTGHRQKHETFRLSSEHISV